MGVGVRTVVVLLPAFLAAERIVRADRRLDRANMVMQAGGGARAKDGREWRAIGMLPA